MRYCVSDIHGEYELFMKLLEKISFSEKDEMYICGDIIEKGKSSIKLAKFIASTHNMYSIVGNHEYSFTKYYHFLAENSDGNFDKVLGQLQEYFPDDGHLLDWDLVDWFDNLPTYIEREDFICVHAGLPIDSEGMLPPLSSVDVEFMVHDRRFKEPTVSHKSPKCVFFGHTQTSCICGENKVIGYLRDNTKPPKTVSDFYKIHLDTGAWSEGVLGCFCIDTLKATHVQKQQSALTPFSLTIVK